jgi:hypothetical protein
MVFSANEQGLEGTLDVGTRVATARDSLVFDRAALPIVPILSRFDAREERQLGDRWVERIANRLEPLYRPWCPDGVEVRAILERTTIPYISYWSFGEGIPTLEERGANPEKVSWSLETVAALIASGLGDIKTLVSNRDQFVASARLRKSESDLRFDVFLSYSRRSQPLAQALAASLLDAGVVVYFDEEMATSGEKWSGTLQDIMASSRHFVCIVEDEFTKTQEYELRAFFGDLVDRRIDSRVVVVRRAGTTTLMPPALATFPIVERGDDSATFIIKLLEALGIQGAESDSGGPGATQGRRERPPTIPEDAMETSGALESWLTRQDMDSLVNCPICHSNVKVRNARRHLDHQHHVGSASRRHAIPATALKNRDALREWIREHDDDGLVLCPFCGNSVKVRRYFHHLDHEHGPPTALTTWL